MLNDLRAFLQALDIPVKYAWSTLLFGASLLALTAADVWPFGAASVVFATLGGLTSLFGVVVLIVECGDRIWKRRQAAKVAREAKSKADAKMRDADEEAIANLEVLGDWEERQLAWILRNGQKRFTAHISRHSRLQRMGIVRQASSGVEDLYTVANPVWDRRDELLKNFTRLPREKDFPNPNFYL